MKLPRRHTGDIPINNIAYPDEISFRMLIETVSDYKEI